MKNNWELAAKGIKDSSFMICHEHDRETPIRFYNSHWQIRNLVPDELLNPTGSDKSEIRQHWEYYQPDFYNEIYQEYTELKKPRKTRVEKRYAGVYSGNKASVLSFKTLDELLDACPSINGYSVFDFHIFEEES